MQDACSQNEVEIDFSQGQLLIGSESDIAKNTLLKRDQKDCQEYGEEPIQLKEGYAYEYELPDGYSLHAAHSGIVYPSRRNPSRGRITPGIYVGRLAFDIKKGGEAPFEVAVEVRSIKANYRDEYRTMLEDITTECTELLMLHSSAVTQRYAVDYAGDSATL